MERTTHFRFDRFEPTTEEWDYYIQRFETELCIHGLLQGEDTAEARRNLLLSRIGPEPFKVVVDHFRPDSVNDKSYEDLKSTLCNFYGRKLCIMAERVTFSQRYRKEGESVVQFVNALRALAGSCDFGASLDERLRDQLIIGINNSSWQQELFRSHPTNASKFKDVESTVQAVEQASMQQQRLQCIAKGPSHSVPTYRLETAMKQPRKNPRSHAAAAAYEPRKLVRGVDCLKCGKEQHRDGEHCPATNAKCRACQGMHHFANVCIKSGRALISNKGKSAQKVRCVQPTRSHKTTHSLFEEFTDSDESDVNAITLNSITGQQAKIDVELNGHKIRMLYDPGAAQSVVSEQIWKQIGAPVLAPMPDLIAYTNVKIQTLGKTEVRVKAFKQTLELPICVVKQSDVPLFGLNWVLAFKLPLPPGIKICSVETGMKANQNEQLVQRKSNVSKQVAPSRMPIHDLANEFEDLFGPNAGTLTGHKAVIHVRENAVPKVFRPRPVPLAQQPLVEAELKRLVKAGVLEPVDSATMPVEWASPIVTVIKPSGAIRICGDFKVTINPFIIMDPHPLPRFEEITAKLNNGKYFSVVDLKDAYLQMEVDEASRKYLMIATHKGYYGYKRLPFGVSFAPTLFQKTMEKILAGLEGVVVFIDDILITGSSEEEHLARLRAVFECLRKAGLKINLSKCKFLQDSVNYLGHRIDKFGIHPTEDHLRAIREMPTPRNVHELRSFLGSINHYARFIPHLQSICVPLHRLTKAGIKWRWTQEDETIFNELKQILSSSTTLVHYDPNLPIVLTTDASDRGLGAVLNHLYPDGSEKPIAYASRSLSDTESRYAAIDKEALAIIFAVTKFRQYLLGRHFILRTDHRPLERVFGEKREIPKLAANRLTRWALILGAYDYEIQYRKASENAPADALSRLPMLECEGSEEEQLGEPDRAQLLHLRLDDMPLSKKRLKSQIMKDPVLSKVIGYLERGWPSRDNLPDGYHTFFEKRHELSFEENILLWRGRIVVPTTLRGKVLAMLHEGHPGVCAMRSIARFDVWWPKMDEEIDTYVKNCFPCQEVRPAMQEVPLYSWNVPNEPWSRIHLDFAGPFEGKMWLMVVDAHSKWIEAISLTNTVTEKVIYVLRELFARYGLPKTVVSDNGPQFTSSEFDEFCSKNNITHIRTTPYHPKTNGLAERGVRTFKERITATKSDNVDLQLRVQRVLMSYRNTPHKTTGRAPAELFLGRRLRTALDLLKPDLNRAVDNALVKQKLYHDKRAKERHFEEGENVWAKNTLKKGHTAGTVRRRTGLLSYEVEIDGAVRRKHADQLRKRLSSQQSAVERPSQLPSTSSRVEFHSPVPPLPTEMPPAVVTTIEAEENAPPSSSQHLSSGKTSSANSPVVQRRYPQRNRKPPERYGVNCYS